MYQNKGNEQGNAFYRYVNDSLAKLLEMFEWCIIRKRNARSCINNRLEKNNRGVSNKWGGKIAVQKKPGESGITLGRLEKTEKLIAGEPHLFRTQEYFLII